MSKDPLIHCTTCSHLKENICSKHGFHFKDEIADRTTCKDWYYNPKEKEQ